jgi:SAM-dependent methyltransferase
MPLDKFSVIFPEPKADWTSQAAEYCIVDVDGVQRKIRFHEYHEIYSIAGLYEYLFYEKLRCQSPGVVTDLLVDEIRKSSQSVSELKVLEIGAGNGIVGEHLRKHGVNSIIGVDILPEAAEATHRDRPAVYEAYYVEDLQSLSSGNRTKLEAEGFNCLITVGSLGFGDIPAPAFSNAYNLIADNGWIAFNINEEFLKESDSTGFARLVGRMVGNGILETSVRHRYCHRLSVDGRPLYYVAMIARKKTSLPEDVL